MTKTALITGASSGIGAEFAKYHASKGGDVIIVARRAEALEALKAEIEAKHSVTVHVIAMDVAGSENAMNLYQAVKGLGVQVDYLINNAGFGGHGKHVDRELGQEMAMIDLNVDTLVTLTHAFGKDMVAQGGGKILQVGSTAGFAPGPNQAVYFATKAFVNSFSQAVDHELRDQGVTCTVLAPGYVETEFAKSANLENTRMVQNGGATAQSVAKHGYDAMVDGKLVTINERMLSFMLGWVLPLLPRRRVLSMMAGFQSNV